MKLQIWMKQRLIWGSSSRFEWTNRHRRGEQKQGPWIIVNKFVITITMNQSQFLDGKLELNKTRVLKVETTEFYSQRGILGFGATRGEAPTTWA